MADLISPLSLTCFSIVSASASNALSSEPDASPARTIAIYSRLNTFGCEPKAADKETPRSTWERTSYNLVQGGVLGLLDQDSKCPDKRQARRDQGGELAAETASSFRGTREPMPGR